MRSRKTGSSVRHLSLFKTLVFALCVASCILFFVEVRACFMYQWESDEVENVDDAEKDQPVTKDVYSVLLESDLPLVAGRFRVQEPLGSGFVSRAFAGIDMRTQEDVVLKFTFVNVTENTSPTPLKGIPDNVSKLKALRQEYLNYQVFENTRLLQAHFYGDYEGFRVLVTQRGGLSLIQHQEAGRQWSREDVHEIARNVILDLEQLHDLSFIHHDMHTGNIAFKANASSYQVNLIDFNSCKRFRQEGTLQHVEQKRNYFRVPIHRFSPPCSYQKTTCSRRDDLASLGYMLVMLASEHANCAPIYTFSCPEVSAPGGQGFGPALPWLRVTGKQNLIDFMTNISYDILNAPDQYRLKLPANFLLYFEHLAELQFTSRPDYSYLAGLFPRLQ